MSLVGTCWKKQVVQKHSDALESGLWLEQGPHNAFYDANGWNSYRKLGNPAKYLLNVFLSLSLDPVSRWEEHSLLLLLLA